MLSGLVKSNGNRVYLLSQDHDGHLGRMLENGQTYHGITIQADTSETYRGALSSETINQLKHIGLYVENAPDVSGSGHTTNGKTVNDNTSQNNQTNSGDYISGSYEDARNRMGGASGDSSEQRAVKWE